jgi:hypothetical protein
MIGPGAGVVSQIWRYPVKSMGGERVQQALIGVDGIGGDRVWAVSDRATGRILSAKHHPALLGAVARYLDGTGDVAVTLPDGSTAVAGSAELDEQVSRWLGMEAELVPRSPGVVSRFEMDVDDGTLDETPVPRTGPWVLRTGPWVLRTVPGWFFDGRSPIHLLTSSSLAAAGSYHPDGMWDVRRFRPNLLVETGSLDPGFVEDGWLDQTLEVGELRLWLRKACDRCVMTTRAQPGLDEDRTVMRTLVARHGGNLGVLANPISVGTVAEGDRPVLVPTTARPDIPNR